MTLSFINPKDQLTLVVILACLIYFFSSIQDIALDAYRVEYDKYFDAENLATIYQIGYKVGAFLIGAQVYNLIGADNWSTNISIFSTFNVCFTSYYNNFSKS